MQAFIKETIESAAEKYKSVWDTQEYFRTEARATPAELDDLYRQMDDLSFFLQRRTEWIKVLVQVNPTIISATAPADNNNIAFLDDLINLCKQEERIWSELSSIRTNLDLAYGIE